MPDFRIGVGSSDEVYHPPESVQIPPHPTVPLNFFKRYVPLSLCDSISVCTNQRLVEQEKPLTVTSGDILKFLGLDNKVVMMVSNTERINQSQSAKGGQNK